jgi:hypothetical protein
MMMMMIVRCHASLLGRLLAVYLLSLIGPAINAAWAEDAARNAPASSANGNSDHRSAGSSATKGSETTGKGSETAGSGKSAGDKVDAGSDRGGDHDARSGDGAKGGEKGGNKGMQHGEDHTGAKHNETEANPIDTRITVFSKPRPGHGLSWHDRKNMKLARPQKALGDHRPKFARTNKDSVVRNALGQQLLPSKSPANNTEKKGFETTSAGLPKNAGPGPNGGVGPNLQHQGFVPALTRDGRLRDLPLNTTINHSIINGSAMGRPAVRVGAIGGAAKNVTGVINGTDFRPRHP